MKAWIHHHPVSATALASALLFAVVATGLYATAPPPREHVITLTAKRFQYSPNIIEVNRGDKVTIRLLSTDVHHGFYLDGYEQETSARPGMDGSVTFVADNVGRYAFRCSMTCGSFHPYMIGHLRVKPDLRLLASLWVFSSLLAIALVSLRVRNGAAQPPGGDAGTQETQP
ncbi:MAG: cupredoxin domain-containing protein [Terriglobales bacterium]